jgi:hypothetical protein
VTANSQSAVCASDVVVNRCVDIACSTFVKGWNAYAIDRCLSFWCKFTLVFMLKSPAQRANDSLPIIQVAFDPIPTILSFFDVKRNCLSPLSVRTGYCNAMTACDTTRARCATNTGLGAAGTGQSIAFANRNCDRECLFVLVMRLQFDRRRGVVHVSQRKLQESRYVVTQSILTLIKNHLQQTNNLPNRLMITPQPTTNDVANEGACRWPICRRRSATSARPTHARATAPTSHATPPSGFVLDEMNHSSVVFTFGDWVFCSGVGRRRSGWSGASCQRFNKDFSGW